MKFNPFNRNKEALEQVRAANWLKNEQSWDSKIRQAAEIADPAEKVIELKYALIFLEKEIKGISKGIENQAAKKGKAAGRSVWWGTFAGGGAVMLAAAHLPLALAGAAIVFGGDYAAKAMKKSRKESVEKKLKLSAADHEKNMEAKKDAVAMMIVAAMAEHTQEIRDSRKFAEIMQSPELSEVFKAVAAAKELRDNDAAEEKARQAAESGSSAPHAKGDYKHLVGILDEFGEKTGEKNPPAKSGKPKAPGK